MVRLLRFKFPKARNCLGCIDLQTAAEVITIFTLINKVSGFYGILSIFTGNSMNIEVIDFRCADFSSADEHVSVVDIRNWNVSMGIKTGSKCTTYMKEKC